MEQLPHIAIIGVGRLGLCLALNLERKGYAVLGIDVNDDYITLLNTKTFRSPEPRVEEFLKASTRFRASASLSEIVSQNIQLVFIVLPTPSLPDGSFDHGFIENTLNRLSQLAGIRKNLHFVINSTVMPGFTDKLAQHYLHLNWVISYNPEFIAQGSIIQDQQNPDLVLIGEENPEAGNALEAVYRRLCNNQPLVCRMSRLSAEITKLATNCFLTSKIAFANAVGDLAMQAGAEPEKILKAIGSDSRIGTRYFNYGFGYGGPCFPRDNRAFSRFADSMGSPWLIGNSTDGSNRAHAHYLLQQYLRTYPQEETIHFTSVTYKKGSDILEESQQLLLALDLVKAGRKVKITERPLVIAQLKKRYGNLFDFESNAE